MNRRRIDLSHACIKYQVIRSTASPSAKTSHLAMTFLRRPLSTYPPNFGAHMLDVAGGSNKAQVARINRRSKTKFRDPGDSALTNENTGLPCWRQPKTSSLYKGVFPRGKR
ncbi:hypothetical protein O181_022798 [Austropuccinia psidii MF-1]|uniref:Uncharacterized protein n=1 Tax=Austropuccinia psidii MF-1 TaxID=1389203 RepID=A0A9Q3GWQ3_9BASI|nr:hypothetical protein [Austropuccinia psidii MF-1]